MPTIRSHARSSPTPPRGRRARARHRFIPRRSPSRAPRRAIRRDTASVIRPTSTGGGVRRGCSATRSARTVGASCRGAGGAGAAAGACGAAGTGSGSAGAGGRRGPGQLAHDDPADLVGRYRVGGHGPHDRRRGRAGIGRARCRAEPVPRGGPAPGREPDPGHRAGPGARRARRARSPPAHRPAPPHSARAARDDRRSQIRQVRAGRRHRGVPGGREVGQRPSGRLGRRGPRRWRAGGSGSRRRHGGARAAGGAKDGVGTAACRCRATGAAAGRARPGGRGPGRGPARRHGRRVGGQAVGPGPRCSCGQRSRRARHRADHPVHRRGVTRHAGRGHAARRGAAVRRAGGHRRRRSPRVGPRFGGTAQVVGPGHDRARRRAGQARAGRARAAAGTGTRAARTTGPSVSSTRTGPGGTGSAAGTGWAATTGASARAGPPLRHASQQHVGQRHAGHHRAVPREQGAGVPEPDEPRPPRRPLQPGHQRRVDGPRPRGRRRRPVPRPAGGTARRPSSRSP